MQVKCPNQVYEGRNARNKFFFRENAHGLLPAGVVEIKTWNVDQMCHRLQFWGRRSMPGGDIADPTYGQFSEAYIDEIFAHLMGPAIIYLEVQSSGLC